MSEPAADIAVSLIVATLGRTTELGDLLRSLAAQRRRDIEIVIVDQNGDDRLATTVATWSEQLPILWLRTASRGVCRARNLGAASARGSWLVFPDDDCWYPQDALARLDVLRASQPADFYGGRAVDADGRTIMGTFATEPGPIGRDTVWTTMIEWMLAIRRAAFEAVGGFDPDLGPGSGTAFGAYEAQDLALKLLAAGYRGHYEPSWCGHHPDDKADQTSPAAIAKIRAYNHGLGYVMRRHRYSFGQYLPRLMRPLGGIAVYGLTGRFHMARRSCAILGARLAGWRDAPALVAGTDPPMAPGRVRAP